MPDASPSSHSSTNPTDSRSANQQTAIQIVLKKNLQDERLRDAELAMKQMFEREVATVKTVMGYLFDIGSTNLIDKHISIGYVKEPLRSIAKFSRPAFRILAAQWFLANGSKLIADWLLTLVVFDPPSKIEQQQPTDENITTMNAAENTASQHRSTAISQPPISQNTRQNTRQNITKKTEPNTAKTTVSLPTEITEIQKKSAEVATLQKKVRLTASFAIIMTATLGTVTLWLGYERQQLQRELQRELQQQLETTTLTNCQKP